MAVQEKQLKITLIVFLILVILSLHYFTMHEKVLHHAVYRMLFYLPLVLSSFWFGLRGAILVSITVSLLYLPYVIFRWQGIGYDFNKILESILFVFIALILGYLAQKEREKHKELMHSENLAAIGRALSEVAHDMKTPLIAIGGFAQQVYNKPEASETNRKKLNVVIQETARLEMMIKGMLDFGRPIELSRSKTDLNQLIRETLEVAGVMAKQSRVALKRDLEPLPSLLLESSWIRQAILNLITNAIQASPPDGDVWISTRHSNGKVVLEVIDHGCGIPEENAKQIFQPFVSKKKGGAGLGLAIVKRIVDAHGGEVSLSLSAGKGVTFSLLFPVI
ncbi:PAS domain-containing sensor histidine kinase [Thermodesulfobacteriota bacterium]